MTLSLEIARRRLAAHALAVECGELAARYARDRASLGITMKGAQDFLTIADGAVETLFRRRIAEAFPDDAVMGEEQGGGAARALWIIDPIDGTANFARGDRAYCVSIGFLADGVPEIGVVRAPALNETWLAARGAGATLNGEPVAASATDDIRRASIEIGWAPFRPAGEHIALIQAFTEAGASVKRNASGALALVHVAGGRSDAFVERFINAWDVAAGLVIAREAGAVTNDYFSGDWAAGPRAILVAAPRVAAEVARISGIA
jgi:myo-inositol-1(or 4)-monophosphatase